MVGHFRQKKTARLSAGGLSGFAVMRLAVPLRQQAREAKEQSGKITAHRAD
jgi:hypothetical protein